LSLIWILHTYTKEKGLITQATTTNPPHAVRRVTGN
jgi:hypothetical protein